MIFRRLVMKKLPITRFELTKRVLVLVGLAGFMLLGLIVTRSKPKIGWFGVLLFGVMTILSAIDLIKFRDHQIIKGDGTRSKTMSVSSILQFRKPIALYAELAKAAFGIYNLYLWG